MFVALTFFGTRPEVIKLAPVISALERRAGRIRSVVATTSQHDDLLAPLIAQFGLKIDHDLKVAHPDQSPSSVLTRCLERMSRLIEAERPDVILVQGDTTTALAGALAGFYHRVPVAHVEAGLRTGDLRSPFPEEAHRLLIARVTRWHFAATRANAHALRDEGIASDSILRVGNPVVDAVKDILAYTVPSAEVQALLETTRGQRRILLTTHRRENFGPVMEGHLATIRDFVDRHRDVELIFPVHPNPAVRAAVAAALPAGPRIHIVDPMGYADFIHLASRVWLIASDSGGIQEEAPTLGKPLVVLRDTTERPEAIDCGIAQLAGHEPARLDALLESAYRDTGWVRRAGAASNPFGDGRAGERIGSAVVRLLEGRPISRARGKRANRPVAGGHAVPAPTAAGIWPALPESSVSNASAVSTTSTAAAPAPQQRKVTVVLPAYNEERDLPALLPRIRETLAHDWDYRVLVIDDASTDATPDIVTAFSRTMPVTLIQHQHNGGLGAAIRTGLKAATELEGVVVTLDADNSQGPELIPAMLAEIDAGADVVIASRFCQGSAEVGVPGLRLLLSHGASWTLRMLIGYPGVRDYSCGFRAYRGESLRSLITTYGDNFLRETGFSCMLELLINLRRIDAEVVEVPLVLRYDLKEGASKMRILRTLWRYLVVIWRGQRSLARLDEAAADLDLRRAALARSERRTLMGPESLSPATAMGPSRG